MTVTDFEASIHASHQPGSSAQSKLDVAAAIGVSLGDSTTAQASANLGFASSVLQGAASVLIDVTAQGIFGDTASMMLEAQAKIGAGEDPVAVLGAGLGLTVPSVGMTAGIDALINAQGQLELQGTADLQAAVPLLGGMLDLAISANENGITDWGVGVALPFASGVAFNGALSGDSAGLRNAQMVLGYSGRWQHQQETVG